MQGLLSFSKAIDRMNDRMGRVVCYLTLIMVLTGAYNAIVRYLSNFARAEAKTNPVLQLIGEAALLLNSNMFIELQWYLFSLVFLLGAGWTLRCNAHVRVDVLYGRLAPRNKAWIDIAGTVLFLFPFCALMLWAAWPVVVDSWARLEGSPDPGGLPRYPLLTAIPVAFLLLFAQGGSVLIRAIHTLRGLEGAEDG